MDLTDSEQNPLWFVHFDNCLTDDLEPDPEAGYWPDFQHSSTDSVPLNGGNCFLRCSSASPFFGSLMSFVASFSDSCTA